MGTKILESPRNDYLKIIAIVTMLIDHIGYVFYPELLIFRTIGRIAFPIYAYFIAAGYKFSSDRLKYALRLFLFALIAYVPYIYFNPLISPSYLKFNVIFLLLAGLGAITLWDRAMLSFSIKGEIGNIKQRFFGCFLVIIFVVYMFTPKLIETILTYKKIEFGFSYGTYGLFLIMIFYWFYDQPIIGVISFIMLSFFDGLFSAFILYRPDVWVDRLIFDCVTIFIDFIHFEWQDILSNQLPYMMGFFFQSRAIIGVVLVYLLKPINARLNLNKYFFYWFYPVHIVVILLIYGSLVK